MQGIARVRLLLPHHGCTDLRCISDPEFVAVFLQHSLEPLRIEGRFHPDSRRTWKAGIKLLGFSVLMFQPALEHLTGCRIQHRNLLEARMKITTYNEHRSAPFLRALVESTSPSLLGRGEPTPLSNQLTANLQRGRRGQEGFASCFYLIELFVYLMAHTRALAQIFACPS
jgi:hypothetical protein